MRRSLSLCGISTTFNLILKNTNSIANVLTCSKDSSILDLNASKFSDKSMVCLFVLSLYDIYTYRIYKYALFVMIDHLDENVFCRKDPVSTFISSD